MGLVRCSEYEAHVRSLLQEMTLEEKIGQMIYINFGYQEPIEAIRKGQVGLIANVAEAERMNRLQRIAVEESRLGIPILFGNDVLHGYRTIFPIPLAEACSWDPELYRMTASLAAEEASAEGTHLIFAPMVDVTHEPRWGRIAESPGEDPYLAGIYAAAKIEGFQSGIWEDRASMAACVKHFVAYGAVEGGRDYNATDVSNQLLANLYLPPFRSAVDAGVHMVMTSFNDFNGVPVTANAQLQQEVLRNVLGFDGVIIGDDKTIAKLIPQGLAANAEEACEKAILAGADMDMNSGIYQQYLALLVCRGRVPEELIEEAAARVLRLKFKLGLFDRPFAPSQHEMLVPKGEFRETARKAASKSIVLLKNEGKVLPLEPSIASIAVIGPLAKEPALGCWSCYGEPQEALTVFDGIKAQASGETQVLYARGCGVTGDGREGFAEALTIARRSELAILVVGEIAAMSGEGMCRASLRLPGVQEALVQEICETGTPVVVVLMNGRPLVFEEIAERVPAIVEAWFLGSEAGNAVADVLFGQINPSGKLTVTFPRSVGQIPMYYNQKRSGRSDEGKKFATKYLDLAASPRYPFGYGLSYTDFVYGGLQILPKQLAFDETLEIRAEIENAGDRAGEEIVQLYIQDVAASITRPVKELKSFQRLSLAPGEVGMVKFLLDAQALGFYNEVLQRVVEPGRFRVWVGPDSISGLEGEFDLIERHSGKERL